MIYQAAIFDMDGLLLDTERVSLQAFSDACDNLSLPFHRDIYLSVIGTNAKGVEERIVAGYGPDLDYPVLRKEWMRIYHANVDHHPIPVKAGVVELLEWFRQEQIPLAVATSTGKMLAQRKLELAELRGYFSHLSCGDEISHGKPDPEIYLLAASRQGVAPQLCLAFEDSNLGVQSAVAAEMQVTQVPDLLPPCDQTRQLGHNIEPSLEKVLALLKQQRSIHTQG